MLTPLLLLWPLSLGLTWFVAQGIADRPYDRALEFNLQALTQFVTVEAGRTVFALTPQARDLLRADDTDLVFYQVLDRDGRLVSGDPEFPAPPEADTPRPGDIQLRDGVIRDEAVRIAYTWLARGPARDHLVLMQVAETRGKRSKLATEIVKGVMVPQFIILPLAVLLVWLALVHGIRPLSELEQRIRARRPDDLSPIDDEHVPREVAPLVSSINDLLQRLKVTLSNQKRFLADAAHQLKTPLAGLRMQAEMAQKQLPPGAGEEVERSLRQIATSSVRATHTVNQLLALARAEAAGRALPREPVDLVAVAREVVEELVPLALDKAIDLGFETQPADRTPTSPPIRLLGNPTLLAELVRNLADNALRYTPRGGVVTVRVLTDPFSGVQVLQVEDSGPGIPAEERERVLAPFYRALGTNVDGSGLGLAIVLEIVQQHGAALEMEDADPLRPQARGLRVSVRFQAAVGREALGC
ncbi:MAG: sensor histidine kinase N-terminal domain-containing protein [Tepidimonas sp.]|uniref:sensor histidine kinase N-terminal domain-containing protein n=1 Tax=Tepidimonas sp. TaxID=2002775 RepID=UPI00259DE215|nr:sensor histidine kinase N-terminal domain-containing protein [Tepidimonas sp.]MDM7456642.1 sensor histidine kinase N-terminal domain-containing protein [Tepidimonas sp.]